MRVLLIDNYDSYTYNLYQQIAGLLPDGIASIKVIRNDDYGGEWGRCWDQLRGTVDVIVISPGELPFVVQL